MHWPIYIQISISLRFTAYPQPAVWQIRMRVSLAVMKTICAHKLLAFLIIRQQRPDAIWTCNNYKTRLSSHRIGATCIRELPPSMFPYVYEELCERTSTHLERVENMRYPKYRSSPVCRSRVVLYFTKYISLARFHGNGVPITVIRCATCPI